MKARHFEIARSLKPNRWDGLAFVLIVAVFVMAAQGIQGMRQPIAVLDMKPVSLNPHDLPYYALRTVLRMLAAMAASLVFTFTFAPLAARSRRANMVLIPLLDVFQSVPVLGFISFTVVFFLHLFPGSVLGAECASIFAIFTSQAANMAFSFYQSLITVPHDLEEVSRAFRFSAWQRFWRLEVPFGLPALVWNMMISMSGGWFFVVASEAVTVGNTTFTLPGVGSYVAEAIIQRNLHAIGLATFTMFIVILAYDQLLFRPLVVWSERFRSEQTSSESIPTSWVLNLFTRTRLLKFMSKPAARASHWALQLHLPTFTRFKLPEPRWLHRAADWSWYALLVIITLASSWKLYTYIYSHLTSQDVLIALRYSLYTLMRVSILIFITSLIWVPIGVWVGLRPRVAEIVQPIAQFSAAFPANLFFPVFVMIIAYFNLMPDIWLSPLMVLGTQWYILFNVIAGAMALPLDLREAAASFHIRGWQWWKKVILPGIFPYYVTGAITASGGSWNASIVSEIVSWGKTTYEAHGIGSYIANATSAGDYPRIVLGVASMCFFVILFNRIFWNKLYQISEHRLRLD